MPDLDPNEVAVGVAMLSAARSMRDRLGIVSTDPDPFSFRSKLVTALNNYGDVVRRHHHSFQGRLSQFDRRQTDFDAARAAAAGQLAVLAEAAVVARALPDRTLLALHRFVADEYRLSGSQTAAMLSAFSALLAQILDDPDGPIAEQPPGVLYQLNGVPISVPSTALPIHDVMDNTIKVSGISPQPRSRALRKSVAKAQRRRMKAQNQRLRIKELDAAIDGPKTTHVIRRDSKGRTTLAPATGKDRRAAAGKPRATAASRQTPAPKADARRLPWQQFRTGQTATRHSTHTEGANAKCSCGWQGRASAVAQHHKESR